MLRYIIILSIVMFGLLLPDAEARSQTNQRCFLETGLCIEGRIREFWEQNGGLQVFFGFGSGHGPGSICIDSIAFQ